ncbi:MAG TPA: DUF5624 domain-containing protein [Trebonia sp.]|jgi:hypothetical protein|nr:DUF5624 domain-containing protein [Trebonia sp.]
MPPATFESAEFVDLFTAYTASPDSIGAHLAQEAVRHAASAPLLVVTGTDLALYSGDGAPPVVEPYRLGNRGFKELAAISHLGPAVATVARLRELARSEDGGWRADAARLLGITRKARAANTLALWRDQIAVRAFAGREERIAAMTDYSCQLTERFLQRALDEPGYLTMEAVRRDYLQGPASDGTLPVPVNKIMIATFYLTGMDLAHRLIAWFDKAGIDWDRAMVILAGQVGRPTAGVTEESHSIAGVIRAVSRGRLAPGRLFVAPHAPVFPPFDPDTGDASVAAGFEAGYRQLWAMLRGTGELGGQMFEGYPRFAASSSDGAHVGPGVSSVPSKPAVSGPGDWLALVTRLRVVMEDPRQLLSGAVTDYASSELVRYGNDPAAVTVPGLDGEPYPRLVG